jgi:3-hydroxyacyl-[acyl-carrier-protein] dehydratase
MRWFWIDRFTRFESGRRAEAVKAVTITEEHVDEYFAGYPMMTPTLVLEGFAQMGGLLIGETRGFKTNIVLAKVSRSKIHRYARPGDLLRYSVKVESLQEDGGLVSAVSQVDGESLVEAELTFAQVSRDVVDKEFFDSAALLRMLRIFKLYEVGVDADGQPLQIPAHLLDAERAVLANHLGGTSHLGGTNHLGEHVK